MFSIRHVEGALLAACAVAWFAPSSAATRDSETKEVQSYVLTDAGLAAWAVAQPGGKLPAGTSKANVDFFNKHQAELKKLEALGKGDECETEEEDGGEDQQ